jgi:hypothetical protein
MRPSERRDVLASLEESEQLVRRAGRINHDVAMYM